MLRSTKLSMGVWATWAKVNHNSHMSLGRALVWYRYNACPHAIYMEGMFRESVMSVLVP